MGLTIRVPGKIVFLVPWPDHWLIGTTDAPFDGPAARPSAAGWEVDRLLDTVNATMDVDLTRADVVGTYAGLRPLIAPSDGSTVKASREHRVTVEANGVVRIGGGKYTTYRVMARDVIDAVLGREAARQRPSDTAERRLVGAADTDALARIAGELSTIAAVREVGPETAARLVARHGTEAPAVVALGAELDLLRPLVPGRFFLEAEVAWAVRHELAFVARRRARAPHAPRPGAARPRCRDRPAGRGDHGRRPRLGRMRASRSRSRTTSPARAASSRWLRPRPMRPPGRARIRATERVIRPSSTGGHPRRDMADLDDLQRSFFDGLYTNRIPIAIGVDRRRGRPVSWSPGGSAGSRPLDGIPVARASSS